MLIHVIQLLVFKIGIEKLVKTLLQFICFSVFLYGDKAAMDLIYKIWRYLTDLKNNPTGRQVLNLDYYEK